MPSKNHELPLEMVRKQPDLVPELLRSVFPEEVPRMPDGEATLTSETYNAFHPQELRCDATILVGDPKKPSLGIIVESQLRDDPGKGFSWPAYVANFRLRHKCDTILLVFCPDEQVARACSNPIRMGHPNWNLKPLTLHPGELPPVTDPEQARKYPALAILSAGAHVEGPDQDAVKDCFLHAVRSAAELWNHDIASQYHDYGLSRASSVARKLLEEHMQANDYELQSDFARRYEAKGEAKGEIKALLLVLEARKVCVSKEARGRIVECGDREQLEEWLRRAATVTSVEELFD
ncbi:hypothetical protein [Actinomadura sediminis]|uniref:DUF4365 domain-containing protein n=1 Tax=Actinomadura sediminis TaxID=1038904 RepID=A0ABW3EIU7_9ACTN